VTTSEFQGLPNKPTRTPHLHKQETTSGVFAVGDHEGMCGENQMWYQLACVELGPPLKFDESIQKS